MAGYLVPGPVDAWAILSGEGTPRLLGHSRGGLTVDIRPNYNAIQCDLFGEEPAEDYYGGKSATISGEMIRINFQNWQILMEYASVSAGNAGIVAPFVGADLPGEVGTLMVQEGQAYQLLLKFPYAPKPAFNVLGNVMVSGYRFYAVYLIANPMSRLGPRPKTIAATWQARRKVDLAYVDATYGAGKLNLFDYDVSALNGLSNV